MEKIPTIKEIAKRLKVSTSTVSRALHGHHSIGLVTTMRVRKVANELNYEPNQTAILFKQRKTFSIGVIVPNISEAFFSLALSGVEEYASKRNYNVFIGQSLEDPDREKSILETMKNHRVDGIIISISKNTVKYEVFEQLKRYNIPIVFFDRIPIMKDIHYSACNLRPGMLQAIDRLIEKGHKNIGLINGPSQLAATRERLEVFKEGLDNHKVNISTDLIVSTDLSAEQNQNAMKKLIFADERPTAVIAFNDYVALDAISIVRNFKLVVNRDISFISFSNLPIWQYMDNLPLVSIEQFPKTQGIKAAEILFKLFEDGNKEEKTSPVFHRTILDSIMVAHTTPIKK